VSLFARELAARQPAKKPKKWLFLPYDQLTDQIGPLAKIEPDSFGVVLVENPWHYGRRPFHKQKLALILSNLRHFALEQADQGRAVRYLKFKGPYRQALNQLIPEMGQILTMDPAERELQIDLQPLIDSGSLRTTAHQGWLTTADQFRSSAGKSPVWLMDSFYRRVRKDTGLLMEKGKPLGNKFSLDAANRLPWKGYPPAPEPPSFPLDPIKKEVGQLIQDSFGQHPGRLDLTRIPASRADAAKLWSWAKRECLQMFGPYEDAMSTLSRGIFHTRISALLNIHRLLPQQILTEVQEMDIPLSSKEGFVRQILGWREFIHHIHRETDGFRLLPGNRPTIIQEPGDGGFGRWRGQSWFSPKGDQVLDGGAAPSYLGCQKSLPPAFWGEPSGLACLDTVISDVWEEGYSHHITRLMILANIATLLDVYPRELTDWFWLAYTDAYDWVVEPNVLGMGTYALGDLMTTKPYISGTPYISKMSDYCRKCSFEPKKNCPISSLYWAFLERHGQALKNNPRLKLVLASAAKRSLSKKEHDRKIFLEVSRLLSQGQKLSPDKLN